MAGTAGTLAIDPDFAGVLVRVDFDFFLTIDGLEISLRSARLKSAEAADDSGAVLTTLDFEDTSAIDDKEVALKLDGFNAFCAGDGFGFVLRIFQGGLSAFVLYRLATWASYCSIRFG